MTLHFVPGYCGSVNTPPSASSLPSVEMAKHLGFAILDHDYVMQESAAAQQARLDIDHQRAAFQDEINKNELDLRERETALVESQRTVTAKEVEEYTKKQREYETDFSDIQRKFAEKRRQLDESFYAAREIVVSAIAQIISEIAVERSFELILPRSIVLHADKKYDITDEVLNRLNKVLPKINLDITPREIVLTK